MTKKNCIKPVAAVIGAAFVGSLSAVSVANAADNPFGATQLESGYMQLASNEDGKCGEGKCSGEKKMTSEGKCSGEKEEAEGKCSGEKKEGEGKCGGEKKEGEGKCGK